MIEAPDISFCVSSNRPFLWKRLYEDMKRSSGSLSFEIIAVGPVDPDFSLPNNFKHIKTGNIKVPQCFEISMKNFQGKNVSFIGDDSFFDKEKDVENLYKEYNDIREKNGSFSIIIPRLIMSGKEQPLRYAKMGTAPLASLNCALFDRNILEKIGGADIRFLSVYWDCDMAMRFQEAGGFICKSKDVVVREYPPENRTYLHRSSKPHDKSILNEFWTRVIVPDEKVPSDSVWCYMSNNNFVISKRRLKELIGYSEENILTLSQGPKEYGNLKWD